ncbi:SurA N-terminal domain-containing protein [Thiovibrio frasassiensis]|uniref:Periplasmic chaperone PpiD n=1 Tax=Thiovibrio frasassiensis TaxID=2984131 RepID=A0A9X4MGI7_9BACT|nr:SurA N-terminal domain-containing protein [Thiovibrio frasassiensis]MDG4475830.1 SurA N-terminal domain-containing protein [Thiovibrio frasassiensis]
MLDFMRRKAQSTVIQAAILIIVLVFIFWGVGTSQNGGPDSIATVNDQSISSQQYQRTYNRTIARYQEQFGSTLPAGLLEALNLKQQVLNQMVQELVMQQGATEAGLIVGSDEVRKVIQGMDAFKEEGIFKLDRYKKMLASSKMTTADFENSVRNDLLHSKIIAHLSRFARVSDSELKDRFALDNDQLKLEYVAFGADDFRTAGPIADQDLNSFFAGNKQAYLTEPQVKLRYITFLQEQGLAAIQVSDQEIEQFYTLNPDKFSTPEQRQARHILIRSDANESPELRDAKRKKLAAILALAKAGKDFSQLAREHSEDASGKNGGDLGFFSKEQMVPPFAEAAFALTEGEISGVVETQFGFHLIKLEKIRPASVTPLAAARDQIAAELKAQRGKDLTFQLANQAYEGIIQAGSLDKYAASAGAAVQTTDSFSQANPPKALTGQPALLKTIFSLKMGELSSLLEINGGYAICFVDEVKEPQVPPLTEVRARVEKDFLDDQAHAKAKDAAVALLDQTKKEGSLIAAAEKTKSSVRETPFFTRSQQATSTLPAPVVAQGLKLSAASPYPKEIGEDGSTFYVLHFKESKSASEEAFASQKEALRKMLTQEKQMEVMGAWLAYLQSRAKITIDKKFME